jgi:hypothetical protein
MVENTNFSNLPLLDKINLLLLLHKTLGGLSAYVDYFIINDPEELDDMHQEARTQLESNQFHAISLKNHIAQYVLNLHDIMRICSELFFEEYTKVMNLFNE